VQSLKPPSLYSQEKILQYILGRRLVGLTAVLDIAEKTNNLLPLQRI
jgi:hypothetical protein